MKIQNRQRKLKATYLFEEKKIIVSKIYRDIKFLPSTFDLFLRFQIIGYNTKNLAICFSTSSTKSVISDFSISRQLFRKKAMIGLISGITKF
jgi:ribosomal protein S14